MKHLMTATTLLTIGWVNYILIKAYNNSGTHEIPTTKMHLAAWLVISLTAVTLQIIYFVKTAKTIRHTPGKIRKIRFFTMLLIIAFTISSMSVYAMTTLYAINNDKDTIIIQTDRYNEELIEPIIASFTMLMAPQLMQHPLYYLKKPKQINKSRNMKKVQHAS